MAGYAYNPDIESNDVVLARYSDNGTLDSSFGVNGKVTTDVISFFTYANSIAIQRNKIIVAGYIFNSVNITANFALACFTADGTLDFSFGENGKVITLTNSSYVVKVPVAVQGNKIIVAGDTWNTDSGTNDFILIRYTTSTF